MNNLGKNQKKKAEERKHKYISLLFIVSFIVCISAVPVDLFAQSTPGSRIPPEQWEKKKPTRKPPLPSQIIGVTADPTKELHLPPLDMERIQAEDRANLSSNRPSQDAIIRTVDVSPLSHGEWFDINDGKGSIWLFQINAPSASAISVYFTDVSLPKGARLYVYSPLHQDKYYGPYQGGPDISSDILAGNSITIELTIPFPYDISKPLFKIKSITHFYRSFKQRIGYPLLSSVEKAASCHNDASCPQYSAWAMQETEHCDSDRADALFACSSDSQDACFIGVAISGNTIKSPSIERR